MGTIPARALYMTELEVTKSNVGTATFKLGYPEPTAAAVANAAAGLSAAMVAQLDWIPMDVVNQRLMVQGGDVGCPWWHNLFGPQSISRLLLPHSPCLLPSIFSISLHHRHEVNLCSFSGILCSKSEITTVGLLI